jgi:hypothetical protein
MAATTLNITSQKEQIRERCRSLSLVSVVSLMPLSAIGCGTLQRRRCRSGPRGTLMTNTLGHWRPIPAQPSLTIFCRSIPASSKRGFLRFLSSTIGKASGLPVTRKESSKEFSYSNIQRFLSQEGTARQWSARWHLHQGAIQLDLKSNNPLPVNSHR